MTTVEKDALRRHLTNLPDCYRQDVRDMIAETEGAHKVPVDGVENWAEIVEAVSYTHLTLPTIYSV